MSGFFYKFEVNRFDCIVGVALNHVVADNKNSDLLIISSQRIYETWQKFSILTQCLWIELLSDKSYNPFNKRVGRIMFELTHLLSR